MQNTIVLSASTLRIGRDGTVTSDDAFYKDDNGKEIVISQYYSQLEPVVRYMLRVLNTRNDITDKTLNIVMLCTEEVKNVASFKEKNGNDYCMNAVEYLKHRINVCEEKETGQTIDFETIDLDKRKPYKAIRETIEKIRSIKAETNDVKGLFWVDVHGGLRQIAMALEAIISLLEIDEIIPDDIFSVEYSREENKSEITNENELFKIYDFVSGMNDFINFGNADLLEQYYEKRLIEPSVSRVVHAMNLIAKGTQFCDMVTYKNGLEEMKSALADIKEKEHDDFLTIFIEYIEKSFKSSFDEILKSPIPIIERCIEKKLYQQALTFIESTMPEYIVDLKILYATKDTERNISKCKNRYESDKQFIVNQYINQHLMYFSKEPKRDLKKAINEFSYYYLNRFEKSDDNSNISCMKSLDFKKNNQIKKIVREKKTVKEFVIKIRSDYLNEYSKMDQQVGMFLRMHKALKSVRNMFNHTIADERPDMDAIINTMKLYVAYAKRIENLARKSDGTIY